MTAAEGPLVLGVDPGASGALALLGKSGQLLGLMDMPFEEVKIGKRNAKIVDPECLCTWIVDATEFRYDEHGEITVFAAVEKVGAMPGQGVTSTFNFGDAYGKVLGVLAGLEIPTTVYRPGVWKGFMGLSSNKDDSRIMAATVWPDNASWFKRKRDDGRAEAALIALYHLRLQEGYR
jgi:hypothetical protein